MIARWIQIVLGGWLVMAPYDLAYRGPRGRTASYGDVLHGLEVMVLAFAATRSRLARVALFPLGLWVIVAPVVLDVGIPAARWNGWVAGILVALLALFPTRTAPARGPQMGL